MLRWTKLGGGGGGGAQKDAGAASLNGAGPHVGADGLTDAERQALEEMDRFYGMENFGNTCYANSVLQSLYFCRSFRDCVNTYPSLVTPFVASHVPPTFSPLPTSATLASVQEKVAQAALSNSNHSYSTPNHSPAPPTPGGSQAPSSSPSSTAAPPEKEKKASRWPGTKKVLSTTSNAPPLLSPALPVSSPPSPNASEPTAPLDPNSTQLVIPHSPVPPASLFIALQTLFRHIASIPPPTYMIPPKDKDGNGGGPPVPTVTTVIAPAAFVGKLKLENEMFRGAMQQDAHEFLNYLLNKIGEDLESEEKERKTASRENFRKRLENGNGNGHEVDELSDSLASLSTAQTPGSSSSRHNQKGPEQTFVQKLFEGKLTNETRCLTCETTSSRDESFLDLSIDIEQNSSITACLRQFSASETLCQRNKFYCDTCCGLQEAEKRMKIKTLPNVLALHLKRFKYQEELGRYVKLNYRVTFPFQLRLFNTSDDSEDPDRLYELFAIVVHVGGGPHHGHYIAIAKTGSGWMMFDDDTVSPIDEADIQQYYGESAAGSGYVLFYQAIDLDPTSVGLRSRESESSSAAAPASTNLQVGQQPPNLDPASFFPPVSPNIVLSAPPTPSNGVDSDVRTPLLAPPIRPPLLDMGSQTSTIMASPSSPIRESSFSPPPPPPTFPQISQTPPRSPIVEGSNPMSELGRSLAAKRSPALPPSSMPKAPPSVASSSLSRASSMASLPPPAHPSTPLSTSKEKESSGGHWFSRKGSSSKDKSERRISSSTSWYGSHNHPAPISIPISNGSSSTSSTNELPGERSQTGAGSTPVQEEDPRTRQPSPPGQLEQSSSFDPSSAKPRLNGVVPRSRDASTTIAEGVVDNSSSSSSNSSIPNLDPNSGLPSARLSPLPPFAHSHVSPSLLFGNGNSSTPPTPSPPTNSHVPSHLSRKETKEEKKEREKAEKEAEKRKKIERKSSIGPGMSTMGKLGGLGRSSSMAMKIGFGKRDHKEKESS
ncbi:hypothetical protein BDY24DRAFT_378415 [Mrakia frigida]|uniref:uncharacterized protein n=1 Tax=Mrakia frigida TaxID=29902 RepID=UPI003FCC246C